MSNIDFSPLFRSMIGFDRLSSALENAYRSEPGGYPPYNVEVSGESDYRITMAVAGFSPGELAREVKENILTVSDFRPRMKRKAVSSTGESPIGASSASSSLRIMFGWWMPGSRMACSISSCAVKSPRP